LLKILEIVTLRNEGLRGQAWVIYSHIAAATAALRAEQGFTFFGKDLRIDYAREKSDRVAKLDGTFVPKDRRLKREREGAINANADSNRVKLSPKDGENKMDTPLRSSGSAAPLINASPQAEGGATASSINEGSLPLLSDPEQEKEVPSNILFAGSLPKDCNEMMLAMLFRQYAGYKEVRVPRQGLAFIEFDDEPHATAAFKALNGFKLTASENLDLKYGKTA